jgi:hypothetical protein
MGFAREYLPMIESYSGPGSPYWGAKAFGVLALPSRHAFWNSPEEPLPIERSDDVVAIPAAGFLVRADRATGQVQVVNGKSLGSSKKYSNLTYSTHCGYEIDRDRPVGAIDPFGEANLTLSRDGRNWYGRNAVRFAEIRDGVLITEAVYRLGEQVLARTAIAVGGALTAGHPEGTLHRVRSWVRARARAIYLRVAPRLTPRATVLTAVTFAGDQQIRAHRVRSRVKVLAREGGFACGWDDEREPELRAGAISYVRTLSAASGIRPLIGYERAISPLRSDHNVLHLHSGIPHVETARARRGLLRLASVSLARPAAFPAEHVGVGVDGKAAQLMAMLEESAIAGRPGERGKSILSGLGSLGPKLNRALRRNL